MRLQYEHNANTRQLQYEHNANTRQLQYEHNAITMRTQCIGGGLVPNERDSAHHLCDGNLANSPCAAAAAAAAVRFDEAQYYKRVADKDKGK